MPIQFRTSSNYRKLDFVLWIDDFDVNYFNQLTHIDIFDVWCVCVCLSLLQISWNLVFLVIKKCRKKLFIWSSWRIHSLREEKSVEIAMCLYMCRYQISWLVIKWKTHCLEIGLWNVNICEIANKVVRKVWMVFFACVKNAKKLQQQNGISKRNSIVYHNPKRFI